ncbi:unnamed protein product [Lampetra fluviatilis]
MATLDTDAETALCKFPEGRFCRPSLLGTGDITNRAAAEIRGRNAAVAWRRLAGRASGPQPERGELAPWLGKTVALRAQFGRDEMSPRVPGSCSLSVQAASSSDPDPRLRHEDATGLATVRGAGALRDHGPGAEGRTPEESSPDANWLLNCGARPPTPTRPLTSAVRGAAPEPPGTALDSYGGWLPALCPWRGHQHLSRRLADCLHSDDLVKQQQQQQPAASWSLVERNCHASLTVAANFARDAAGRELAGCPTPSNSPSRAARSLVTRGDARRPATHAAIAHITLIARSDGEERGGTGWLQPCRITGNPPRRIKRRRSSRRGAAARSGQGHRHHGAAAASARTAPPAFLDAPVAPVARLPLNSGIRRRPPLTSVARAGSDSRNGHNRSEMDFSRRHLAQPLTHGR